MFKNFVYTFEKTLLLQSTLILSICWHEVMPFLKLSTVVNFIILKTNKEISRKLKKNFLVSPPFFFPSSIYDFSPFITLPPFVMSSNKKKKKHIYKLTSDIV